MRGLIIIERSIHQENISTPKCICVKQGNHKIYEANLMELKG